MLGFLFGTACLVGLVWVFKRGRHDRYWSGERRGRFGLRWLLERLDTTPGQEKAIGSEVDRLFESFGEFKRAIRDSNKDVARAIRAEDFNAEILGDVFARHDSAIGELRKSALGTLAHVHEVLDSTQRARLADLIESLPGRWGGPYRSRSCQEKMS